MKNNKIKEITEKTTSEGLGSCYERISLYYLLPEILKNLNITSVLETPVNISKGWDNLVLLEKKYKVVIGDRDTDKLRRMWPYSEKPGFTQFNQLNQTFSLVWNFAVIHQHPEILELMLKYSRKYILIFTPNILNWGTPIHWGLHLLTWTKCEHPEKGNPKLMTLGGLKKFLRNKGLTIVGSGYFDLPFWPDFAFSKKEILENAPFLKKLLAKGKGTKPTEKDLLRSINKALVFEEKLPRFLEPIFAHHQYVLAQK